MSAITARLSRTLSHLSANRQFRGFILSVIVMALISFIFFYPDNIEGNDLRQHDMMQGMANSHEIEQYEKSTGEKSWWTNALFGGMPTFQISPSYSSNNLFGWVTKVYGLFLPAPSNLLFMMMVGFMILMLALRVKWEYGLIGAIAWGLSSYFVIIIGAGHIWKFVTLAYIPPTIGGVLLAYRGRVLAGGAMTAFFTMMQLQANHIQMTYYFGLVLFIIIAAYAIDAIKSHQIKQWAKASGILAVAAILGILANLPNIYHTAKYAKETQRAASELVAESGTQDVDREYITTYSYGKMETFTLLIPDVKGGASIKPERGENMIVDIAPVADTPRRDIKEFLSQFPQYFGEPEMTNGPVYVGVIIVALFIVGLIVVTGPLKWALLIATLLSIGLAWGRNLMPLTDLFIDIVPMYSKFRTPESILVIAQFTMPLLGILGLCKILSPAADKTVKDKQLRACYIGFGAVALFCLIGILFPSFYGLDDIRSTQLSAMAIQSPDYAQAYNVLIDARASMVSSDSLRSLVYLLLAGAVIWLYLTGKLRRTIIVAGALVALVAIDLYTVDKRYIDHDSFVKANPYARNTDVITPTPADLAIMADTDPNYRVMDFDRLMQATPSYFHKTIGGYHAAKLGRYQDLLNRIVDHFGEDGDGDLSIPGMLNARYLIQGGQVMRNPYAQGNAWFIDRVHYVDGANAEIDGIEQIDLTTEAVADRKFAQAIGEVKPRQPGDTIYLTSYAPDRLTYRAKTAKGATATFSEIYFPWGWEATIDGKPTDIARVNYILRAVTIPAGDHEIVMTFKPQSVAVTTTIAIIAVLLIYIWVIASAVRGVRKEIAS